MKRQDFLDNVILWGLILQVVIVRWLDIHEPFNFILVLLIFIRVLLAPGVFFRNRAFSALVLLFIYMLFNKFLVGGTFFLFAKNTYRIFKTLVIIWYVCSLAAYKTDLVITFFKRKFTFFNLYFLANIPIIIAQLNGHFILLGLRRGYSTNATLDFVSGLFGVFGMPRLNLFILFLFFYNLEYCSSSNKTIKLFIFKFCNYAFLIYWIIMGTTTDNKGFYLCVPMYIAIYIFCKKYTQVIHKIESIILMYSKMFGIVIFIGLLLIVTIYLYNPFREIFELIIETIIDGVTLMNKTGGSNERFGYIAYAWNNKDYRWIGAGIGKFASDASWGFGFAHFGQSDLGTYMILGGLISIILFYLESKYGNI